MRREAGGLRCRHHLRHQQRVRFRLPARQHGLRGGERVQRKLNFAIVDEVDSILIDEARTPLIISGQAEDHTDLYVRMNQVAPMLTALPGRKRSRATTGSTRRPSGADDRSRPRARRGMLTARACCPRAQPVRRRQHPADPPPVRRLRAHNLFLKDQQYVVQNGEVVIVDEFTGRLMSGRRWSDGLHQAVEAKEGVRSRTRTRRWPRSPSRTTSACTASWPA
jgi:preprotein translocase subunit SecA